MPIPQSAGPPQARGGSRSSGVRAATIAILVATATVFLVGVGIVVGRYQPESTPADNLSTPETSTETTTPTEFTSACPASITDTSSDGVRNYDDRGEYPIADIVMFTVACSADVLTFAVDFATGSDMSISSFAVVIDVSPGADDAWQAECPKHFGADFSYSVGGFSGTQARLLDFHPCTSERYSVVYTGTTSVNGTTLSTVLPYSAIGVRSGDVIALRAESGTLLDGGHVIDPGQDYAPDSWARRVRLS